MFNLDLLAAKPRNSLIFGPTGSGKGFLARNAIRELKAKYSIGVFVIDPKDDNGEVEVGEWDDAADVIRYGHTFSDCGATQYAIWLQDCLNHYKSYSQNNNQTLLLIDEASLIDQRLSSETRLIIGEKLKVLISTGSSWGINLWVLSQTPFVLGFDRSVLSHLDGIAIVQDYAPLKQWNRLGICEKISPEKLEALITNSHYQRAIYWQGDWYSL